MSKHPDEYTLITKKGQGLYGMHKRMPRIFRLAPFHGMPNGYTEVTMIDGQSVYDEDGRLRSKFIAYKRYIPKGY